MPVALVFKQKMLLPHHSASFPAGSCTFNVLIAVYGHINCCAFSFWICPMGLDVKSVTIVTLAGMSSRVTLLCCAVT